MVWAGCKQVARPGVRRAWSRHRLLARVDQTERFLASGQRVPGDLQLHIQFEQIEIGRGNIATTVVITALRFSSVASRSARATSVARRSLPQISSSKERRLSGTLPNVRSGCPLRGEQTEPLAELRRVVRSPPAVTFGNCSDRVIPRLARAA